MGHCSTDPNYSSYALTAGFLRRATAAGAGIVALMASVRTGEVRQAAGNRRSPGDPRPAESALPDEGGHPGTANAAPEWLTSSEAASRLGVKRSTIYAYLSRGILSRTRLPSLRGSYFSATEIDRLAERGKP